MEKETTSQDGSSRVITVTGVARYLFEDTLAFFRSIGEISTFEYAGKEPDVLHIVYANKVGAESALTTRIPAGLSRFGVKVRGADPETCGRFLNGPDPQLPPPDVAKLPSAPSSQSVLEPLKVLTDAQSFLAP